MRLPRALRPVHCRGLPGAAQALVREDTRVSISVDAAEEARRYSISRTVAGPALPSFASPPRPHVASSHTLLTPSAHTRLTLSSTHPPHTTDPPHRHKRLAMLEEKQDQTRRYLDEAARLEAGLTFQVSIGKTSFTSASLSKLPQINSPAR